MQFPEYFKEYLLILNVVAVICSLPYVIFAYKKKKIKLIPDIRFLYIFAALAIIQNVYNVIYTIIVGQFDSALFFPVAGITSTLAVVIVSRVFLKEKLSYMAYVGVVVSVIAITLLSL
jgi:drug/metabolite transporter (DMT)-like permease